MAALCTDLPYLGINCWTHIRWGGETAVATLTRKLSSIVGQIWYTFLAKRGNLKNFRLLQRASRPKSHLSKSVLSQNPAINLGKSCLSWLTGVACNWQTQKNIWKVWSARSWKIKIKFCRKKQPMKAVQCNMMKTRGSYSKGWTKVWRMLI